MATAFRWLHRMFSPRSTRRWARRQRSKPRCSWDRYLLQLERLEDRTVPATIPSFAVAAGSPFVLPAPSLGGAVNGQVAAIADFDGNGIADVAILDKGSSEITFLFGQLDGTFSAPANIATLFNPTSLAVGDFNNDKLPDLVVPADLGKLQVLINKGGGTFESTATGLFPAGASGRSVAVGHFDSDANLDVVVTDPVFAQIYVEFGDGTGGFKASSITITTTGLGLIDPQAVVVGDFDGVNGQDFVVADLGNDAAADFLNDGSGSFAIPVGGEFNAVAVGFGGVAGMATGDFNADGIPDLAALSNLPTGNVNLLLGKGDGTFLPATGFSIGSSPASIAVADINHDGTLDILTTNSAGPTNTVGVLRGNGLGMFSPALSLTLDIGAVGPTGLAVGDLNGDGLPDIVTGNAASNNVSVLLNTTSHPIIVFGKAGDKLSVTATDQTSGFYSINGGPVVFFSNASSFHFADFDGGSTMTVFNPPDDLFAPPGGISYAGGGSGDLKIMGGVTTTQIFTFETAFGGGHNGLIGLLNVAGTDAEYTYLGLGPVLVNAGTPTDIFFNLPASDGDNAAILEDNGDLFDDMSQIQSGKSSFETTQFVNPSGSLTVDASDDGETLTIGRLDPGFIAHITYVGGMLGDELQIDTSTGSNVIPVHGITFDGTGNDGLTILLGYTATAITTTYSDALAGTVLVDGRSIAYFGVGTHVIDGLLASEQTFNFGVTNDIVTLGDDIVHSDQLSEISSTATSTPTIFRNPTSSVTVNLGLGSDIIHANPLDASLAPPDININGFNTADPSGDGSDQFFILPSPDSTFTIDGDAPTPAALPGDELNVDPFLATGLALTSTAMPDGIAGHYSFTNRKPVNFREIETVDGVAGAASSGPVMGAGSPLVVQAGVDLGTLVVATFTDPAGPEPVANYSADIAWGDGLGDRGLISFDAATSIFTVSGRHVYGHEGFDTVTVTVHHGSAADVTATAKVSVVDAPVFLISVTPPPASAGTFFGRTAVFVDYDNGGVSSDFRADIAWGDGTTGVGTVIETGIDLFDHPTFIVIGSHTYAATPNPSLFQVAITDVRGGTITMQTANGSDALEFIVYFDPVSGTFKFIAFTYR